MSSGSALKPRSRGGTLLMLAIIAFLIWMTISHPAEAIVLFEDVFGAIGELFSAVFQAYQEGRNS